MSDLSGHNLFDCNHGCSRHGGRSDPAIWDDGQGEVVIEARVPTLSNGHTCLGEGCQRCLREPVPSGLPCAICGNGRQPRRYGQGGLVVCVDSDACDYQAADLGRSR